MLVLLLYDKEARKCSIEHPWLAFPTPIMCGNTRLKPIGIGNWEDASHGYGGCATSMQQIILRYFLYVFCKILIGQQLFQEEARLNCDVLSLSFQMECEIFGKADISPARSLLSTYQRSGKQ